MSSSEELPKKRSKRIKKKENSKKKGKFDKSYFIDDYAESADEEESEIDSEYEAEYEEALKLQQEYPKRKPLYENMTAEEIAEKFESKVAYQNASYLTSEISTVAKQQYLPSVNDPKLWQVFCRPGKSRELAINLMQKSKNEELPIFSVFASNIITDCIYIEAFNKHDVLMSIKNMTSININKIIVVPIKEMADVFLMDLGPKIRLAIGEFVRVKFGLYKNDLAQVIGIEEHIGKVTVRLVPRIDLSVGSKKVRAPSKLFNPADFQNSDKKRDLSTQEVYYTYQGNIFKDGFLQKTLALRSLKTEEIKPTLAEIKVFDDNKVEMLLKSKPVCFAQGDKVKVISGESKGLTGSIDSSDSKSAYIFPFIEEICDRKFEYPISDLCKYFEIGDHVKVIEGRYSGITGMVVSSKDNIVDFISDVNRSVVTVLANDLKLSEEISSGQEKCENIKLHEIVLLKNELNFGIVTKITPGCVVAVFDTNETVSVWYHEISKRYSPFKFSALDRDNNKLSYNDMVRIIFPRHAYYNKFGTIKNALRGIAFIQIQDGLDTIIIAVKSGFCVIQGKSQTIVEEISRKDLKGELVKIKSGPYRGNSGKVIDVSENKVSIELSTMSKVVVVDVSACERLEEMKEMMNIVEHKKTPAVHSPGYTPNYQSPWESHDTPSYKNNGRY